MVGRGRREAFADSSAEPGGGQWFVLSQEIAWRQSPTCSRKSVTTRVVDDEDFARTVAGKRSDIFRFHRRDRLECDIEYVYPRCRTVPGAQLERRVAPADRAAHQDQDSCRAGW